MCPEKFRGAVPFTQIWTAASAVEPHPALSFALINECLLFELAWMLLTWLGIIVRSWTLWIPALWLKACKANTAPASLGRLQPPRTLVCWMSSRKLLWTTRRMCLCEPLPCSQHHGYKGCIEHLRGLSSEKRVDNNKKYVLHFYQNLKEDSSRLSLTEPRSKERDPVTTLCSFPGTNVSASLPGPLGTRTKELKSSQHPLPQLPTLLLLISPESGREGG